MPPKKRRTKTDPQQDPPGISRFGPSTPLPQARGGQASYPDPGQAPYPAAAQSAYVPGNPPPQAYGGQTSYPYPGQAPYPASAQSAHVPGNPPPQAYGGQALHPSGGQAPPLQSGASNPNNLSGGYYYDIFCDDKRWGCGKLIHRRWLDGPSILIRKKKHTPGGDEEYIYYIDSMTLGVKTKFYPARVRGKCSWHANAPDDGPFYE